MSRFAIAIKNFIKVKEDVTAFCSKHLDNITVRSVVGNCINALCADDAAK